MHRFYFKKQDSDASSIFIKGDDASHIIKVLRLKPGAEIILVDESGLEYESIITDISKNSVTASLGQGILCDRESPVDIIVAQALLKDRKMDTMVRQFTQLGIKSLVPYLSVRSISRPDPARLAGRIKRWNKIAMESLKQCRRRFAPDIHNLKSFDEVIQSGKDSDLKIIFWENSTKPMPKDMPSNNDSRKSIFLVFGPEGGFSQSEIETASQYGFVNATLGPRILRAETAPVAACAITQYIFGDMGNKSLDKL